METFKRTTQKQLKCWKKGNFWKEKSKVGGQKRRNWQTSFSGVKTRLTVFVEICEVLWKTIEAWKRFASHIKYFISGCSDEKVFKALDVLNAEKIELKLRLAEQEIEKDRRSVLDTSSFVSNKN